MGYLALNLKPHLGPRCDIEAWSSWLQGLDLRLQGRRTLRPILFLPPSFAEAEAHFENMTRKLYNSHSQDSARCDKRSSV